MSERRAERRKEPRVRALNPVNVAEFTEVGFRTDLTIGRTLDLSHEGMRIELSHPLPLRSTVSFTLALGETMLELNGRVRAVTAIDEETCAMGIEFVDLSPEQWEDLDVYLELREGDG